MACNLSFHCLLYKIINYTQFMYMVICVFNTRVRAPMRRTKTFMYKQGNTPISSHDFK